MRRKSSKPVLFSTGKPVQWWQRPAVFPVTLAAAFALIFGVLAYVSGAPDSSAGSTTEMSSQSQGAAQDAVQRALSAGKPTVVEFGANSCVSCREMKPILRVLAQDRRITVADVDIIKERDYISRYQIRLMPTQVFYDAKGQETSRHLGQINADEILERLGVAGATTVTLPKAAL